MVTPKNFTSAQDINDALSTVSIDTEVIKWNKYGRKSAQLDVDPGEKLCVVVLKVSDWIEDSEDPEGPQEYTELMTGIAGLNAKVVGGCVPTRVEIPVAVDGYDQVLYVDTHPRYEVAKVVEEDPIA